MQKQILSLGLVFDFFQNEWNVVGKVAQTDVAEGIRGCRLDFFIVVVEAFDDLVLQSTDFAQVPKEQQKKFRQMNEGQKQKFKKIVKSTRGK